MAIDTSTFETTLDSKIDAATTSDDAKSFLLLAKAVEAINNAISSSGLSKANNLSDLLNTTTALTNLGFTATIAELNYTDGVTSNIQTQLDGKVGAASPTFTGTATAPTINASTALQIGGVAITSTAAELNILDGVTATAAELNYNDITTLGLSQASKAVTADANGVVSFDNGTIEESTSVTSSSNAATLNLRDGNVFEHTLTENVTYTFSNPASSGKVSSFVLKIKQDSSASGYTVTFPSSVDFVGGTAPTLTATANAIDTFVIFTTDGGTIYNLLVAGQDIK